MFGKNGEYNTEKFFAAIGGCYVGEYPHRWDRCPKCDDRIGQRSYSSRYHRCNCRSGYIRIPVDGIRSFLQYFEGEVFPTAFDKAPSRNMRPVGRLEGIFCLHSIEKHAKTGLLKHYGYLMPFDNQAEKLVASARYVDFLRKDEVGEIGSWWRISGDTSWASAVTIPRNRIGDPVNYQGSGMGISYSLKGLDLQPLDWGPLDDFITYTREHAKEAI